MKMNEILEESKEDSYNRSRHLDGLDQAQLNDEGNN